MKVKDCRNREHFRRRTWAQYYKPKNYHAIGFSHAYAYCEKFKKRVLEVKKCEKGANDEQ